jgi:hypothetical protein
MPFQRAVLALALAAACALAGCGDDALPGGHTAVLGGSNGKAPTQAPPPLTDARGREIPAPKLPAKTLAQVARAGDAGALAVWIQDDLFSDGEDAGEGAVDDEAAVALARLGTRKFWLPGMDVVHDEHGQGWVWGSGRGVVTVRFETATTPPGRVLSFAADDPALKPLRHAPEE